MGPLIKNDQRAFTLLEILAALGILSVIFVFFFQLTKSYEGQNAVADTRRRMETIVESAKAYYLSHGDLPKVLSQDIPADIPVGPGKLDVDPKFRFDGWQREMRYISYTNDGVGGRPEEILIDPLSDGAPDGAPPAMVVMPVGTRTLLRAIEFEGRRVAGLIISSGPDQVFSYGEDTDEYPAQYQSDDPTDDTIGDDIILPIDLTAEATQIALAELNVLNEKVKAFEDRYLGVDNNRNSVYDEAGCTGIPYGDSVPFDGLPDDFENCSQLDLRTFGFFPPATNIDINCGRPTLDYMKAHFCPQSWTRAEGCPPGYFMPEIADIPYVEDPNNPVNPCPGTPRGPQAADYARIPFVRGAPSADDCHWGLVETQYGDTATPEPNETDADQARAFIFCLFNLNPDAIVDPWLNGYVWGCGSTGTRDVLGRSYSGCQYVYPADNPRYHRFFSAGPNAHPLQLELDMDEIENEDDSDDIIP